MAEEGGDRSSEDGSLSVEEDEEEVVNEQVNDAPFEVLQKLRSLGESGRAAWNRAGSRPLKRDNKNRPQELPSKRPVPRLRKVIEAPSKVVRDPRFESLCGELDESRFKAAYGFLYTENLPEERQKLQKLLKKEKDATRREEHKLALKSIDQQLKAHEAQAKKKQKEAEQRQKQKATVKEGKTPFFPKKSEKRKQALIEKYQELKAAGKLEAFLAKRRKRNASKEHKKLPDRRSV